MFIQFHHPQSKGWLSARLSDKIDDSLDGPIGWPVSRIYWIDVPANAFEPMVDGVIALRETDEVSKVAAALEAK